jgi:hypothetical protein
MKVAAAALAVLLAADAALYSALRVLSGERAELERERADLSARAGPLDELRKHRVSALVSGFRSIESADREIDIAELRDRLLGAERGLAIDRFSLDFRPEQSASKVREGGRVAASVGGSFDALRAYLARIEGMRLPLAVSAFSLRKDSERVLLAIEWQAVWGRAGGGLDELSDDDLARLERWIEREPAPLPERDLFSPGSERPPTKAPRPASQPLRSPPPPYDEAPPPVPFPPKLLGFVVARAELEAEVGRRVLAAIRIDDELVLVGRGDVAGAYRVLEIEPRVSVLLVHQGTGERLSLYLE